MLSKELDRLDKNGYYFKAIKYLIKNKINFVLSGVDMCGARSIYIFYKSYNKRSCIRISDHLATDIRTDVFTQREIIYIRDGKFNKKEFKDKLNYSLLISKDKVIKKIKEKKDCKRIRKSVKKDYESNVKRNYNEEDWKAEYNYEYDFTEEKLGADRLDELIRKAKNWNRTNYEKRINVLKSWANWRNNGNK